MTAGSHAAFARPHFVLFTRSRVLLAQRMILDARLVGNPVSIADDISVSANAGAAFAVSDGGTLVYRTADAQVRSLVWIDRTGRVSAPVGALSADALIRLSGDGKRVTFSESRGDALGEDVYVHDLERNVTAQLTRHPNRDHNAIWSPDDARVVFDGHRDGPQFLYEMRADGTGAEQTVYASKPESRSPLRPGAAISSCSYGPGRSTKSRLRSWWGSRWWASERPFVPSACGSW